MTKRQIIEAQNDAYFQDIIDYMAGQQEQHGEIFAIDNEQDYQHPGTVL